MSEKNILVSWIGEKDLDLMRMTNSNKKIGISSSVAALVDDKVYKFSKVILVQNYRKGKESKANTINEVKKYVKFLKERSNSTNL